MKIETVEQLRSLYPPAKERAVRKQLSELDTHCRRFIELSPFAVVASGDRGGRMDASPRGGAPGFIKATSAKTLLLPDAPGNNRLDTLENIIATGAIGILFMIPGIDETLRVNGDACLSCESEDVLSFTSESRQPKLVIKVSVREAYLHCAKALMRSRLWNPSLAVDRSMLPTMGEMINSQTGRPEHAETQEEMVLRYAGDL